mgnify:CR=1 FL=1
MDDTLHGFRQFKIDNIHNEKETNHTASTLYGYINMPMVNTIYGYQDSELNHMPTQIIFILPALFYMKSN